MANPSTNLLLQLTRAAFALRLFALAVGLVLLVGSRLAPTHLLAMGVLGIVSVMGLLRSEVMQMVARHPLLALVDLVMVAVVGVLSGSTPLMSLAMLSTAVLIGLWVEVWADVIILVALLALLGWQSVRRGGSMGQVVTMPFAYVALWFLAVAVRRAVDQERRTSHLVRASVVAAASAEERSRVAGELHDQVAKSIQGTALAASTLPSLIRTCPEQAVEIAEQTQQMATQAVADLRAVMTDLRHQDRRQPMGEALVGVVQAWENRAGRSAVTTVDPRIEVPSAAAQFEVLASVEELLDNVAAHAGPCEVRVTAVVVNGVLFVSVADDGRGIAAGQLEAARAAGHLGVDGVQARLVRVGGSVAIDSAPGEGTTVDLTVPLVSLVERRAS